MNAIVVIPARGGSKGIPRKNLVRVGGLSLVGRSVLQGLAFAERVGLSPESVVVDTDSEEIAAEARRWGANVPFLRPAELALDTTRTVDSVIHLIDRLGASGRSHTDVVLLQPTSPLRIVDDILAAWAIRAAGSESVITIAQMDHPLELALRLGEGDRLEWVVGQRPASLRRQGLTTAYFANGAVYVCAVSFLRREGEFVKALETHCVRVPSWRSGDIDTYDDLLTCEALAWRTPLREETVSHPKPAGMYAPVVVSDAPPAVHGADAARRVIEALVSDGNARIHVRARTSVAAALAEDLCWTMSRDAWTQLLCDPAVVHRVLLEPRDAMTLDVARDAGITDFARTLRSSGVLAGAVPPGARVVVFSETFSYDSIAAAIGACAASAARAIAVVAREPKDDPEAWPVFLESLSAVRARFGIAVGAWETSADDSPFRTVLGSAEEIRGITFDMFARQQRP